MASFNAVFLPRPLLPPVINAILFVGSIFFFVLDDDTKVQQKAAPKNGDSFRINGDSFSFYLGSPI
jgi:uncharacterized membrane protein